MKGAKTMPVKEIPGTRDAVENSIDISKEDKRSSWAGKTSKIPGRVARWYEHDQEDIEKRTATA